jgi:hypothetical protein
MTRHPIQLTLPDLMARWKAEPLSFLQSEIILENDQPLGTQWDQWQETDFEGTIAHQNALILRPRGHDKTGMAGSMITHSLICGRAGQRIYSVAADQQQADLLLDDVIQKFRRNPRLARLIKTTAHSVTVSVTGSKYETLASDAPSAFGLRPDMLVVDELAEWPARGERLWQALWSASGKKPDVRTLIISSPGGQLLSKIRDMAVTESNWYTSERGQCASWISPTWLDQQRRSLPDHVFRRLHLGEWTTSEGMYLTGDEVQRIFRPWTTPIVAHTIGLDLGIARDRAVIAVLGVTQDGLAVVEKLFLYTPSRTARVDLQEVEADVITIAKQLGALVVADPWQAVLMSQRLGAHGVPTVEYTFSADGRKKLFARLLDVIRNDQLRALTHPELEKELMGLQIEEHGSGWRVDHQPGQHDDCVVAVCLALAGLEQMALPDPGGSWQDDAVGNFLDTW